MGFIKCFNKTSYYPITYHKHNWSLCGSEYHRSTSSRGGWADVTPFTPAWCTCSTKAKKTVVLLHVKRSCVLFYYLYGNWNWQSRDAKNKSVDRENLISLTYDSSEHGTPRSHKYFNLLKALTAAVSLRLEATFMGEGSFLPESCSPYPPHKAVEEALSHTWSKSWELFPLNPCYKPVRQCFVESGSDTASACWVTR